ncbi:thioredoxin domain-containing protein [Flavobacterium sp. LB3P122]|uniref:thioredoxin domain-containing protein n=1 Tax=Flavobacterium algoriphilum TaxID=3398738 RepID=UPI003A8453BC
MKFHSICLIVLSFVVLSCTGQTSKNIKTIEAKAFAEKIAATPNTQILDVRTPEEFASEHIDNAKNVNWLSTDFVTNTAKLDKSKPIFVYCKSGGRSQNAAEKLNQLGFTTIYQLAGGILKWDAAGLAKPSDKIIGMCSQEYAELLNSDKKVLINFYAEWCAPCKKMTPYLLKMQKELADKVTIIRLNADENKTLLSELKITELPTLLLYENKKIKWKNSGFISEDDLKKQL